MAKSKVEPISLTGEALALLQICPFGEIYDIVPAKRNVGAELLVRDHVLELGSCERDPILSEIALDISRGWKRML